MLVALAQETRLEIFRLLARRGEAGMPAGRIAEVLGIPAPTLSFHLKELSQAGLIESRREGRTIRYAFRIEATRGLLAFLGEDCCDGHPELCLPRNPQPEATP